MTQMISDGTGTLHLWDSDRMVYEQRDLQGRLLASRVMTAQEALDHPSPVEDTNAKTLKQQAQAALQADRDFVALASPTTAQTLAQVKALSRQVNGLIRNLLGLFDGTN